MTRGEQTESKLRKLKAGQKNIIQDILITPL